MTYHLHCVVSAIGVPYNDTFRPSEEDSWDVHWTRAFPMHQTIPKEVADSVQEQLRAAGDRVVPIKVSTKELVEYTV